MKQYLYQPISQQAIKTLTELNEKEKPTFLIPTRFISTENAQLAYLLNDYYNEGRSTAEKTLYRSFFVSSRYEAIQGAIKLMRHNGFKTTKKEIAILDPQAEIQERLSPLDDESLLIPGVVFANGSEKLQQILRTRDDILGVILINSGQEDAYAPILRYCKEKEIITLWMDADYQFGTAFKPHQFEILPDMFVLGEGLVDYEIPFAVFSMTKEIHQPWSKMASSLLHSSTYSGNKLSVLLAVETIRRSSWFQKKPVLAECCSAIAASPENTIKAFSEYVNPGMVNFYKLIGYDFICERAHGSEITIKTAEGETKTLTDAVSGGGAAICGHSPKELVVDCSRDHDTSEDYMQLLENLLKEQLSFPYCFPAVSGATAVENAITLALLAGKGKKRILTFNNNYGGNTLISLICTGDEELHDLFAPNYPYVTYLDPFSEDAAAQLKQEIKKGDLALVWMELVQGGTLDKIPEDLLKIINDNQAEYQYYIGIDEILMGFYRLGSLTSYEGKPIQPDIVTFSKALTGSSFPMGATLVSEEIYQKANLVNPNFVKTLKNYYKNQYGAHVAINSITALTRSDQVKQAAEVANILEEGFRDIESHSELFTEIKGQGHIYALEYKSEWMSYYFCKKAIQEGHTFLYIDRVATALTMTTDEAKKLIVDLKQLYAVRHPSLFKLKGLFINLWMTIQFMTK